MLRVFFLICVGVACVTCSQGDTFTGIKKNINAQVDPIMAMVAKQLIQQGYDPLDIDELHVDFTYKPLLITHHLKLTLSKLWLQNFHTIHRSNDTYANVKLTTTQITLPLSVDTIEFGSDFHIKMGLLSHKGGVLGTVRSIDMDFLINFSYFKKEKVKLVTFNMTHMGEINLEFTGHVLTDWFTTEVANVVSTVIKDKIYQVVENIVHRIVDVIIEKINRKLSGTRDMEPRDIVTMLREELQRNDQYTQR